MSGESFADLLAPNLPAIRKFVQARMRVSDHVDDVVQQTLMHAFVHRHQLRAESNFKSWISSIAMNETRGLARRTRIYVPLNALPHLASGDRFSSPHQLFEQTERAQHLARRDGVAERSRPYGNPSG